MPGSWLRLVMIGVLPLAAAGGGCASSVRTPVTRPDAIRVERDGLAAEFAPSIDRVTFFGPSGGENLLHVVGLDRQPPTDGSYVFWGGCYTWVSPQKAPGGDASSPMGWVDVDGTKRDWPPDPAMDVGPARRTGLGDGMLRVTGPEQRSGLAEIKSLRVLARDRALFSFTLRNAGGAGPIVAGPWINTAAGPRDAIAVRMPPGTEVYGWNDESVARFNSVLGPADERGWRRVDLSRAAWDGGIKVYLAPPRGERLASTEIAVWRRDAGAWMHRDIGPLSADEIERLRAAGEGPVAVYIQPSSGGGEAIVEAELYGPIRDILPGAQHTATETWRVIESRDGSTAALP